MTGSHPQLHAAAVPPLNTAREATSIFPIREAVATLSNFSPRNFRFSARPHFSNREATPADRSGGSARIAAAAPRLRTVGGAARSAGSRPQLYAAAAPRLKPSRSDVTDRNRGAMVAFSRGCQPTEWLRPIDRSRGAAAARGLLPPLRGSGRWGAVVSAGSRPQLYAAAAPRLRTLGDDGLGGQESIAGGRVRGSGVNCRNGPAGPAHN